MSSASTAATEFLEIADRGQRRFEDDVGDMGGIVLADRMGGVDHHLDMQAVMPEQQVRAGAADELRRIGQHGFATLPVRPAARRQRHRLVEEALRPGDYLGAAPSVIALAGGAPRNGVGAIERIVKAAPASIGGVEQETGVEDRHHQLRPREGRDLGIDIGRTDREGCGFGHQIADLRQECLIACHVERLAALALVPGIDLRLQPVARGEQRTVLRGEAGIDVGHAGPEGLGGNPGAGQRLVLDEAHQHLRDLEPRLVDHRRHHRLAEMEGGPFSADSHSTLLG